MRILDLSDRAKTILGLMFQGMTAIQIGKEVKLAARTVKMEKAKLYKKLGVQLKNPRKGKMSLHSGVLLVTELTKNLDEKEVETIAKLSEREWQIVKLIAKGWTNEKVGKILGLTEDSIKKRNKEIFNIVGVDNRVALAIWFIQHKKPSSFQ